MHFCNHLCSGTLFALMNYGIKRFIIDTMILLIRAMKKLNGDKRERREMSVESAIWRGVNFRIEGGGTFYQITFLLREGRYVDEAR
jgi:hypothetical protein